MSEIMMGIAVGGFKPLVQRALVLIHLGVARKFEDFVPGVWNRVQKARTELGPLVKQSPPLLAIGSAGLELLDSTLAQVARQFLREHAGIADSVQGTLIRGERFLDDALIAGARLPCPVRDRTGGPSQDGQAVLSETGPPIPPDSAGPGAVSCPGQDRSSISIDNSTIEIEDRGRPKWDRAREIHRDAIIEKLAKVHRLEGVKAEVNLKKSPMARIFWDLYHTEDGRKLAELDRLVSEAAGKNKPAAFLNVALRRV